VQTFFHSSSTMIALPVSIFHRAPIPPSPCLCALLFKFPLGYSSVFDLFYWLSFCFETSYYFVFLILDFSLDDTFTSRPWAYKGSLSVTGIQRTLPLPTASELARRHPPEAIHRPTSTSASANDTHSVFSSTTRTQDHSLLYIPPNFLFSHTLSFFSLRSYLSCLFTQPKFFIAFRCSY